MNLNDIIARQSPPAPWSAGEKIPWNDPEFSRRMLENHLSQEHDWASRRLSVVEQQIEWIASRALAGKKARVLDLGCGPGFYTHRLAQLGHDCVGVDFSPASIGYAERLAGEDGLSIEYVLEDVRAYEPVGRFDLVMMLFSEFNVFRERDALTLLEKAQRALNDNGVILIEVSHFDAVKQQGRLPATWEALETGLFLERPHLYLQEHFWDADSSTATTRYTIVDAQSTAVMEYGASMKAYSDEQYREMLVKTGLSGIRMLDVDEWPVGDVFAEKLQTYICRLEETPH